MAFHQINRKAALGKLDDIFTLNQMKLPLSANVQSNADQAAACTCHVDGAHSACRPNAPIRNAIWEQWGCVEGRGEGRVQMEHCPSTPPHILFVVNKTEQRQCRVGWGH